MILRKNHLQTLHFEVAQELGIRSVNNFKSFFDVMNLSALLQLGWRILSENSIREFR